MDFYTHVQIGYTFCLVGPKQLFTGTLSQRNYRFPIWVISAMVSKGKSETNQHYAGPLL